MEEKRRKYSISSDNSDTTDSKPLQFELLQGKHLNSDQAHRPRSRDIYIRIKMLQTAQQHQVGLAPTERKEALRGG
ncbi:hypothetical protein P7K49_003830 [Saguinus oedipus]|uniref:Uncharacterized protein n=1 Tax=Saguinus oedipus TaxID=9490 RepID=A0ABQ9W5M9_SAGOE|nr:hypothetical protein P7K49_003830 [Saguinus oedipus]